MSKSDEIEQNLGGTRSYTGEGLHIDAEDLCTFSQFLVRTIALALKRVLPLD